jgi:RNA polymerase sigma-70 factor (ECF subfamily)
MRSRALDRHKSARISRYAGEEGLAALADDADVARAPDRARVREAVCGLPAEQREVLELAYFGGLSCSEIAAQLVIPIGTVKSRVAAGLDKLRAALAMAPRRGAMA